MCETVVILGSKDMSLLVEFVQSALGPAGSSPAVWFRDIHVALNISDYDDTEVYQLHDQMLTILLLSTQLRVLAFEDFWITTTTIIVLGQSCARALTKLELNFAHLPMGELQCNIAHIRALTSLRTLTIKTFASNADVGPNKNDVPWQFPYLTHLAWDQFMGCTRVSMFALAADLPPNIISFLGRCCFPRLQHVQLHIALGQGPGTAHMQDFLDRHTLLQHIDIVLSTQQIIAVVPHMTAPHLDLTSFETLPEVLVDLFQAPVTMISVWADPSRSEGLQMYDPLFKCLQSKQTSLKQIHIRCADAQYKSLWDFQWGQRYNVQLIGALALQAYYLKERGIVILDSNGSALSYQAKASNKVA
jgi:hypothetical protein